MTCGITKKSSLPETQCHCRKGKRLNARASHVTVAVLCCRLHSGWLVDGITTERDDEFQSNFNAWAVSVCACVWTSVCVVCSSRLLTIRRNKLNEPKTTFDISFSLCVCNVQFRPYCHTWFQQQSIWMISHLDTIQFVAVHSTGSNWTIQMVFDSIQRSLVVIRITNWYLYEMHSIQNDPVALYCM